MPGVAGAGGEAVCNHTVALSPQARAFSARAWNRPKRTSMNMKTVLQASEPKTLTVPGAASGLAPAPPLPPPPLLPSL
jgi:hypothetical protein